MRVRLRLSRGLVQTGAAGIALLLFVGLSAALGRVRATPLPPAPKPPCVLADGPGPDSAGPASTPPRLPPPPAPTPWLEPMVVEEQVLDRGVDTGVVADHEVPDAFRER